MLTLRDARPDDVPEIRALIGELAAFERAPERAVATEVDLRRWIFDEPLARVVMAERDGEVAGFALWFLNFSTWEGKPGMYLEDLFVRPAHRGRGVGGALLTHLAQVCVARGYTRFQWQVLDWNADAVAFYESRGARVLREWWTCRVDGAALQSMGR